MSCIAMQSSFIVTTIMACIYMTRQLTRQAGTSIILGLLVYVVIVVAAVVTVSFHLDRCLHLWLAQEQVPRNQNRNVLHARMYAHEPYRTLQHPFHTHPRERIPHLPERNEKRPGRYANCSKVIHYTRRVSANTRPRPSYSCAGVTRRCMGTAITSTKCTAMQD